MPQRDTNDILRELNHRLREELQRQGSVSNWNKTKKTPEQVFTPATRRYVADNLSGVVEWILKNIVSRFPPTSRKGQGKDGGTGRHPGGELSL